MTVYLFKSKDVAADVFDGELILMNLESRDVLVLNEAGSVLWTAINTLNTRDQLLDLLREAMPSIKSSQLEASLDGVINALLGGGFLRTTSKTGTEIGPDSP